MEKQESQFFVGGVKEPFINSAAVGKNRPTVNEFVTAINHEAAEKYAKGLQKKHQLAIVLCDLKSDYVLARQRDEERDFLLTEDLDFPITFTGGHPDDLISLEELYGDIQIIRMKLIGVFEARRKPSIFCYEAKLKAYLFSSETDERHKLFGMEEILDLELGRNSPAISVLQKHLADKINQLFNY